MKYSIVIPTYNNCDKYLKPCLESLFRWTDMTDVELIVSANGCTDNTRWYLDSLRNQLNATGFGRHLKLVWNDAPLGFAKATNEGIKAATSEYVILLNNDVVLLPQEKNLWLDMLVKPFHDNPKCGVSGNLLLHSEATRSKFAVFFCAMIKQEVFVKIGLLNEEYGVGGSEDIEFCKEAENAGYQICEAAENHFDGVQHVSIFPLYHKGEGTMYDSTLVQDWPSIFHANTLRLAKKYNKEHYYYLLSNEYERAVFLSGDPVFRRESARYEWAAQNIQGKDVLEIGCSTGYGAQFLPKDINYLGLDYDPVIVGVAKEQDWGLTTVFDEADVNTYPLGQYDTIIAFEIVEHVDNGIELVEKLKQHCKTLLITVPYNEPPGFWGHHHKLHGLNESHFPGFTFFYSNEHGEVTSNPQAIGEGNRCNIMFCRWSNE
jgi:glycosyltransferase involved in cell wall biosynthesis